MGLLALILIMALPQFPCPVCSYDGNSTISLLKHTSDTSKLPRGCLSRFPARVQPPRRVVVQQQPRMPPQENAVPCKFQQLELSI